MHIEHLALWTTHLEELRAFYETYFGAHAGAKYTNAQRQFESYFLTFADGARLELMRVPNLRAAEDAWPPLTGYAHFALSVGSVAQVDALTQRLQSEGVAVVDGPRWTGDGYYESCVIDPAGNRIEITV